MATQFVTAIYTGLEGTRFNGNAPAIFERYKQSLRSIALGGYDIVCYTSNRHIEELTEFYADLPNLKLVVEELEENYFHKDIERIKDMNNEYTTSPSWRSRCVEIMWGKFYWLWKNVADLNPDDTIFWIDAGIFHGGLIHDKWRSENSKGPFDFDTITQHRDLHADLVKITGDKILNITSTQVNHGSDDYLKAFGYDDGRPQYGVIGGIFGGKRDAVLDYISKATELMQLIIDQNVLLKEEEFMHYLNFKEPELYSGFLFDTWYHEDWSDAYRRGGTISLSDFFGVIRA